MRIGVNTRLFIKGKMDGIAWFAYEILRRMVKNHPEHEFVFFFDRTYSDEFVFEKNVKPVVLFPQARHPLLWWWFFEISIRKALKKEKIDLFFSPEGFACLGTDVKTVDIIHDINFEHFPEFLKKSHGFFYKHYFPLYAKKADALVTVSEFSKKDIAKTYSIPSKKIYVASNAAAEDFFPVSEEEKEITRKKWTGGKAYFVFVGTINKRKNIINQLKAYDKFRKQNLEASLVFAGSKKNWDEDMEKCLQQMQYKNDVFFTNYVPTSELNKILSSAAALLYVSAFEGFGVPILEAFATKTPVITSNVTSMPEVAGDAAVLVNHNDPDEISQAMVKIFTDKDFANAKIEKGLIRKNKFSWNKSADILWKIIEKTANIQ